MKTSKFIIQNTKLNGCFIIKPKIIYDERGYFFENFNQNNFNLLINSKINFVQENYSFSKKYVLRGLHAQKGKFAQAKLITVIKGSIYDVVVDFRKNSPTFKKNFTVILNSHNKKQLFIPRGFLHGFVVLSKNAHVLYKCDNYYNKKTQFGIKYNDENLSINWKVSEEKLKISDQDINLPYLKDMKI